MALVVVAGCDKPNAAKSDPANPESTPVPVRGRTLAEARKDFTTTITKKRHVGAAAALPDEDFIKVVRYPSPAGNLEAYLVQPPSTDAKRPAIIWLVGGFGNSISQVAWTPAPVKNDQSGSAFWKAGVITMYPSLRGGNDNRGNFESFYGEVDDVLAAAEYLAKQPGVDPQRIFLGGHSTGGTLALLTAEMGAKFRGVFAFGPVDDVAGYGEEVLVFDPKNVEEAALRSPIRWMQGIESPTFVFEGTDGRSNIESLRKMMRTSHPSHVNFFSVVGADHFSTLQPISTLIARKILEDREQPAPSVAFTPDELATAMRKAGE